MFLTTVDGTRLAAQRTGEGPPVVLIHGSAGGLDSWDPIVPLLRERFELWTYARRGYSPSDGFTRAKTFADDVADVRTVLAAAGGAAHVVGASYGATVALHAALSLAGTSSAGGTPSAGSASRTLSNAGADAHQAVNAFADRGSPGGDLPDHAAAEGNSPDHAAAGDTSPDHAAAGGDMPDHAAAEGNSPDHAAAGDTSPDHAAARGDLPDHAALGDTSPDHVAAGGSSTNHAVPRGDLSGSDGPGSGAIRSLVVFEPPIFSAGAALAGVLGRYRALLGAGDLRGAARVLAAEVARVPAPMLPAISAPPESEAVGCLHDLEAMTADSADVARWSAISVPVLLLQGSDTWSPMPDTMEALAAALPSAARTVLPGQSHFATHTGPDLFAAALTEFLQRHD